MNASAAAKIRISGEKFVAWSQRQPDDRDEQVDGELVAMPRDTFGHNRANGDAVGAAALPCQVFTDRAAVKISEKTLPIADAGAHCGAELGPQAMRVESPVIAAEEVYRSSEGDDADTKFMDDFTVAGICHRLILFPGGRAIVHRERNATDKIASRIGRDGETALDPPGISVCHVALPP